MEGAYINLKYYNKKIQINYHLSKEIRNEFRTVGITSSSENIEETKNKLSEIIQNSHEKRVIIKSRLYLRRGFSRLGYRKLRDIKNFLSEQRPDITFKLAT